MVSSSVPWIKTRNSFLDLLGYGPRSHGKSKSSALLTDTKYTWSRLVPTEPIPQRKFGAILSSGGNADQPSFEETDLP
jgi:hypothetical protein